MGHPGDCGSLRGRSSAHRLSWHADGAADQIFQGRIFCKVRLFHAAAWHPPLDASLSALLLFKRCWFIAMTGEACLGCISGKTGAVWAPSFPGRGPVDRLPFCTNDSSASTRYICCMLALVQHRLLSHFLRVRDMFLMASHTQIQTMCEPVLSAGLGRRISSTMVL